MMPLLFCDLAYPVYKVERLLEIGEGKSPRDVVLVDHAPLWDQLLDASQFHSLHWRHASAAGNAGLAGKIFRHDYPLLLQRPHVHLIYRTLPHALSAALVLKVLIHADFQADQFPGVTGDAER